MKVSIVVDIQTVSIAIASASVCLAAIYYILQLRHQTKIRQTDLVMKLYSQFNSLEFQRMWHDVLNREAKSYSEYNEKYGSAEVTAVGMFFEGIGILLKRKLIDMDLVDDMFTMPINDTWLKMKDITLEIRKIRNRPTILEWFEYLYNEMKKREQQLQASIA
jgi:hypothetical protein